MKQPLMTTREVAEYLGISLNTVLKYVAEGTLPAFRLANNALRYDRAEIEAWLEEHRANAGPGGRRLRSVQ